MMQLSRNADDHYDADAAAAADDDGDAVCG